MTTIILSDNMNNTLITGLDKGGDKGGDKVVKKGRVKGGRGGGGGGGGGGGDKGLGIMVQGGAIHPNVLRIILDFKPFLDLHYHYLFDIFPSNHIPFVHFLIFVIWFISPFRFSLHKLDLFHLFTSFTHFPFHSLLFHIKLSHSISGNNG
jgi:hypothetical protein